MGWRRFSGAGHSVVEVEGCLEQADCPAFSAFLTSAAQDAAAAGEVLEIDLTGLKEISSHGLRVLAIAQRETERVVVTCPEGRVREILNISRMDSVFRVRAPNIHFVRATSAPASRSQEAPAPVPADEESPPQG